MTRHLSQGCAPAQVRSFGRDGRLFVIACAALVYAAVHPAFAQDAAVQDAAVESPPAHISFVEGNVILERDGQNRQFAGLYAGPGRGSRPDARRPG